MTRAPLLPDEEVRLAGPQSHNLPATDSGREYDDFCRLAALFCGVPMAVLSLVGHERPIVPGSVGLGDREAARGTEFYDKVMGERGVFELSDATKDPRFANHPLVAGFPQIRFFAGHALVARNGQILGTLCILDRACRKLKPFQHEALALMARQAVTYLELHQTLVERNQRNEDKDRFLSVIAHDLRSPFSGLLGLTGLLLTEGETMERSELLGYLRMINQSLRRVYELSENLLKWALLDQAKMSFQAKELRVESLFDEVEAFQKDTAEQKHLVLNRRLPPDLVIQGDPNLLEASLRNLLSNAVKFTASGGTITLFAETTPTEVKLGVQDTGQGISREQLEALAAGSAARSHPGTDGELGTGLGLTLVRQLAARHGGDLRLESRVGVGTSATLVFPR